MSAQWEVFGKRTADDPWTAVGAIHAPDAEMALLLAKESFFRHGEGVDWAVVRTTDIHSSGDPSLLEPGTDKSYKLQSGYVGLGGRRREAVERAQAEGRTITRSRPEDKRVRNTEHRAKDSVKEPA